MAANKKHLKSFQRKKCQKGMAIFETLVMILVFVALLKSTLGFYGVTQKMILHSIASRAYGFEQIRNRSNITYLRDVMGGDGNSYQETKSRYFTVREPSSGTTFVAAKMNLKFNGGSSPSLSTDDAHNTTAYEDLGRQDLQRKRNEKHLFEPVWVKVGHGICLRASCGE